MKEDFRMMRNQRSDGEKDELKKKDKRNEINKRKRKNNENA